MSDTGGEDNPAFANDDECGGSPSTASTLEDSHTESLQQEHHKVTVDQDYKSPVDVIPTENGNHKKSFVSHHYVEPVRANSEPQSPQYKSETRIELPAETPDKNGPAPKHNGVNGNGNNNDASFLNTSAASIQTNGKKNLQALNSSSFLSCLIIDRPHICRRLLDKSGI